MHLHPLTLPELMDEGGSMPCSAFQRLLTESDSFPEREKELLDPVAALSARASSARRWWDHLVRWGGMPSLIAPEFDDADRKDWLRDYQELYLQRDLGDLARLSDLEPFVRAQKIAALCSGETVQFAALGAATARRYPTPSRSSSPSTYPTAPRVNRSSPSPPGTCSRESPGRLDGRPPPTPARMCR